jgi:hypothetical protein
MDIDAVILSCRHEGAELVPVIEFRCFVFITIPKTDGCLLESPVRADDLEIIGRGELYRTFDDAKHHNFGQKKGGPRPLH